jgi:plasmid stabilization system protein ParE
MRVRYTVNALRHLTAIAAYIGERNATAAPRVRERIEAAVRIALVHSLTLDAKVRRLGRASGR